MKRRIGQAVALVFAIGLIAWAASRLGIAVLEAMREGIVNLPDPRHVHPAQRQPMPLPWMQAWAYFAGWALMLTAGVIVLVRTLFGRGRLWLVPLALYGGFVFSAGAGAMTSVVDTLSFFGIILGSAVVLAALGIWRSGREHQRIDALPRLIDAERGHEDT